MIRALVFVLALVLSGCGGSSDNAEPEPEASATKSRSAEPTFDGKAYAAKIKERYREELGGRTIKDQCDPAFTYWQCYFDGIEALAESRININLSTPGDVSEAEADAFSERARLAWFNFVGDEFKQLDIIVTFVNGVDSGTTFRRDVPLLNH